jgi:hypothetical protein
MKQYETMEMAITLFASEDIVCASNEDNRKPMPEFPENMGE